jgi:hypothetical protein
MVSKNIEYTVSQHAGHGWVIQRDGHPIGRRRELFAAVSFATHLAEREATLPMHKTRVYIGRVDVAIDDLQPSSRAA